MLSHIRVKLKNRTHRLNTFFFVYKFELTEYNFVFIGLKHVKTFLRPIICHLQNVTFNRHEVRLSHTHTYINIYK